MRKSFFICFLLCSFVAFACGPSVEEFNRVTAENTQLKEENMSLKAALEQCKSELERLKNNSIKAEQLAANGIEVLGKWKVALSFSPNKYFTVEIFKEKGKYQARVEYSDSDKIQIESLKKDGDRFFVVGSENKDYYRIVNGNLRLCDKDGDFTTGGGYIVTKIQ